MQTAVLEIDQVEAKAQYETYRSLCRSKFDQQTPDVRERLRKEHAQAQRILWHAARGRKILNLTETFRLAGVDDRGWPRLAIERADQRFTWCRADRREIVSFGQLNDWHWRRRSRIEIPLPGSMLFDRTPNTLRAVVPTIPPHLLPAGRLDRYHILWDAEWTPTAPKDPILLQHIDGDAWAVLAQWDLTEVERLVLTGRFTG